MRLLTPLHPLHALAPLRALALAIAATAARDGTTTAQCMHLRHLPVQPSVAAGPSDPDVVNLQCRPLPVDKSESEPPGRMSAEAQSDACRQRQMDLARPLSAGTGTGTWCGCMMDGARACACVCVCASISGESAQGLPERAHHERPPTCANYYSISSPRVRAKPPIT